MSYEVEKTELINAYKNLLIVQYNGLPKASATIELQIQELLANMILWSIRDGFDIDIAIGKQLDILGKWVGVDRYFKGQLFDNTLWLAYIDWDFATEPNILQGGLENWNTSRPATDGSFLTYDFIISILNIMNDTDFRVILKLKIVKNNIITTAKNIDDEIFKIFGTDVYTTWDFVNFTLTYNHKYSKKVIIELAKEKNSLPSVSGAELKLLEVV